MTCYLSVCVADPAPEAAFYQHCQKLLGSKTPIVTDSNLRSVCDMLSSDERYRLLRSTLQENYELKKRQQELTAAAVEVAVADLEDKLKQSKRNTARAVKAHGERQEEHIRRVESN